MSAILRPAFTQVLPMPIGDAMARLDSVDRIGGEPVIVESAGKGTRRMIALHPSLRHFWSPWAHLDLQAGERESSCTIDLRFSPNPSLWFAIMFTYLALGTIAFFALCWGIAQVAMGQRPWAMWVIGAAAIIAMGIVLAARVGQRLAQEQMLLMRSALRDALGIADREDDRTPENLDPA